MTAKLKTISCTEIEIAISEYYGTRRHLMVPNLSWGFVSHECDMFIVKRSGLAVEVEIKRSKQDLLADFKKRHNHHERDNKINEFYYAIPEEIYGKCVGLFPEDAGVFICQRGYNDRIHATKIKDAKKIKGSRKLTIEEQLKVAKLGCMRIWNLKRKIIKLT
jgi:hypothetical protein